MVNKPKWKGGKLRQTKPHMTQGLRDLVYLSPTGILVEIGVYYGECTEIFAASGKFTTIHSIDPWKNGYDSKDMTSELGDMTRAENNFDSIVDRFKDRVEIVKYKMTGDEAVEHFADQSIDVVYIDACHKYAAIRNDIRLWLPKVKTGGWIAGHDFSGGQWAETKRGIMDEVGMPDHTFVDTSWAKKVK